MTDRQHICGLKLAIQEVIQQAIQQFGYAAEVQSAALCAALEEHAQAHVGDDYSSNHFARLIQDLLSLLVRHEHQQLSADRFRNAERMQALHDAFAAITAWRALGP